MSYALHRTTAWPLALATACLIVYASLYPFTGWRDQGLSPFVFLTAAWPRYWTGFDVSTNFLGYAPLGFLLAQRPGGLGHQSGESVGSCAVPEFGNIAGAFAVQGSL
jgi:hypothetical protein